ncbi:hypothetical protein [Psychrilyobacter sp.]
MEEKGINDKILELLEKEIDKELLSSTENNLMDMHNGGIGC